MKKTKNPKVIGLFLALSLLTALVIGCDKNGTEPYNPAEMVTVSFDTAGGAPIDPVRVQLGQRIAVPDVTLSKTGRPQFQGLFHAPDTDWGLWTLNGWLFGETPWNFDHPVLSDITLTARWESPQGPIDLSALQGTIVNRAFEYAVDNPGRYYLFLSSNVAVEYLIPGFVAESLEGDGVSLTIIGLREERTIRPATIREGDNTSGTLFFVIMGSELIIGENITLAKTGNTNAAMVLVDSDAHFVMLPGSRITANHAIIPPIVFQSGSAVIVGRDGFFTMKGGEITGNTVQRFGNAAGGLLVMEGGTVDLQGGSIHGNGPYFDVHIPAGTINNSVNFSMSGDAHVGILNLASTATARNVIRVKDEWAGSIEEIVFFGPNVPIIDLTDRVVELATWWFVDEGNDVWRGEPVLLGVGNHSLTGDEVRNVKHFSFLASMTGQPSAWMTWDALWIIDYGADIGRFGIAPDPDTASRHGSLNAFGSLDCAILPLRQRGNFDISAYLEGENL